MRYAGQAFELPVPGDGRPDPAELDRALRAGPRGALRPPRPRRRGRPRRHPPGAGRAGTAAAPAGRPSRAALDRERAPGPLRRRVAGDAGAARRAGGRDSRPRARRSSSSPRRPSSSRPGWSAAVDATGTHRRGTCGDLVPHVGSTPGTSGDGVSVDPVTLQVMIGGLRAACEEMGAVLIRSAYSANIKERHDCSTALFDAGGELVMQAEHIPVHLGSMPDAVAAVLGEEQRPGDAWILNDPYRGGTHLPDITLISPVFVGGELFGFAACRAHHADVGGPTPGGMPAHSRTLEEEGVVIPPTRADAAELERPGGADALRRTSDSPTCAPSAPPTGSASGAWPSSPSATASTACATGWTRSSPTPSAAPAPPSPRSPTGPTRPTDVLEDDAGGASRDVTLRVEATIDGDRLALDFTGTDPQVDGNLNCPLSVTKSAGVLRGARPAPTPTRRLRPAPTGRSRCSPPRAACSTPAPRRRSRPATSRPPAASPTWSSRRSAGARPVPAQGQGTMNNLTLGRRGLHLLRDARRRPGRLPRRATARARSTSRCRTR